MTKKAVNISPLKIENAEEQRLFDQGQKNSVAKKELAKATLRKNTPNDEESDLIHTLWLRQLDYYGQTPCHRSLTSLIRTNDIQIPRTHPGNPPTQCT